MFYKQNEMMRFLLNLLLLPKRLHKSDRKVAFPLVFSYKVKLIDKEKTILNLLLKFKNKISELLDKPTLILFGLLVD